MYAFKDIGITNLDLRGNRMSTTHTGQLVDMLSVCKGCSVLRLAHNPLFRVNFQTLIGDGFLSLLDLEDTGDVLYYIERLGAGLGSSHCGLVHLDLSRSKFH
jgi:hypothetical protein